MDAPLSERVSVIPLVVPDIPGLRWRPATPDDLDALTELFRRMGAEDHPTYSETREELADDFAHSWVDARRDTLVGITDDGTLVAYGLVELSPGQETLVKSTLHGGVSPDHRGRGIGTALLAWQIARAREQLASSDSTLPGWVVLAAQQRTPGTHRLAERAGLTASRWFMTLSRRSEHDIPAVPTPTGYTIERFDPDRSEAARVARNDAFRDHWGSQPVPAEQWASFVGADSFRAEHSVLAIGPQGEVAGFVMSMVVEDDWELAGYSSGYIALVGTVRSARGLGLAPAMLARTLESYRDAGLDAAELDVDSDNPSGALGLYTGLGFVETDRAVSFTLRF